MSGKKEWWKCSACGQDCEVVCGSVEHSCEPYDWAFRTNELLEDLADVSLRQTVRQVVAEVMAGKINPTGRPKFGIVPKGRKGRQKGSA